MGSVDGPMLLEDMSQNMLETNLAVRGVTDKLLDESDFVCTHNIEDLDKKIAILNTKDQIEKLRRQKDQLKKFYEGELIKLKEEIIDLKVKGKKKKERKKSE